MNKTTIFLLIISTIVFFSTPAYALKIVCNKEGCVPSESQLFDDKKINPWYPGKAAVDYLEIENKSDKNIFLDVAPDQKTQPVKKNCNIYQYFNITISDLKHALENQLIWGSSLDDFFNSETIPLYEIKKGEKKRFRFLISLNQNTPNECQGAKASFNFSLITYIDKKTLCTAKKPLPPKIKGAVWIDNFILRIYLETQSEITSYSILYKKYGDESQYLIPNAGTAKTDFYDLYLTDLSSDYFIQAFSINKCQKSELSNPIILSKNKSENKNNASEKNINEDNTTTKNKFEESSNITLNNPANKKEVYRSNKKDNLIIINYPKTHQDNNKYQSIKTTQRKGQKIIFNPIEGPYIIYIIGTGIVKILTAAKVLVIKIVTLINNFI